MSATLLACAVAGMVGCGDGRSTTGATRPGGKGTLQISGPAPDSGTAPEPEPTPAPVAITGQRRGAITTITATDQQVLVELLVDANARGHALEAGMFFRVLVDDGKIFKGLVQVTEVISPTRCIARQVGLTDRTRALANGDRVQEVADLAALAAPEAVESAVRNQQLRLDQLDAADRRLFEAVRANYQQALADLEARHRTADEERERRHNEQLATAEQAGQLAAERREAEARAAEIAARAAMAEAVGTAITEERKAVADRLSAATRERDQVRAQVDGLLAQQTSQAARIEALVREMADRQRIHATQLRAETETREVLQARLDEIEARVAGKPVKTPAVLTADPDHPETVLERLARVTRELQTERAAREKQSEDVKRFTATIDGLRTENAALTARVTALAGADTQATEARTSAEAMQARLLAAERSRDALELARLEAERRFFDLSARILRLTDTAPAVVALQARLRDSLASQEPARTGATP